MRKDILTSSIQKWIIWTGSVTIIWRFNLLKEAKQYRLPEPLPRYNLPYLNLSTGKEKCICIISHLPSLLSRALNRSVIQTLSARYLIPLKPINGEAESGLKINSVESGTNVLNRVTVSFV